MSDIHPHWHSTEDQGSGHSRSGPEALRAERQGRMAARGPQVGMPAPFSGKVRLSVSAASRLPAAVLGIVAVTLASVTMFGGWEAIGAQVGGSGSSRTSSVKVSANASLTPVEIRITATGFVPSSATVSPRQTITWINEQSIPHILTSQTLRDGSGAYLNTPAIFPGSSASITLSPQETERQHTVTSTTDQNLRGTIIVAVTTHPAAVSPVNGSPQPLGSLDGVNLPTGQGTSVKSAPSLKSSNAAKGNDKRASASSTAVAATSVPPEIHSASAPAVYQDSPVPPPQSYDEFYAPVAPQPVAQPETGPEVWVVSLMSVGVLWGLTRKYFIRSVT